MAKTPKKPKRPKAGTPRKGQRRPTDPNKLAKWIVDHSTRSTQ